MKKLIASAGLVTLGAAGLQAAYAPGLSTMETAKPWSIAASLRGFYDDNYNNAPSASKKSSAGIEISPTLKANLPLEQTYLSASFRYSMKYYFDRKDNNFDHLFDLTLKADHRLSERYKISFEDSFVYSVEPTLIDSGAVSAPTLRENADAIRNRALLTFRAQVTEVLGAEVSYQNSWYKYLNNDTHEAALNRLEHLFDLHGTWQFQEHTVGLFGGQYGIDDYTSNLLLNTNNAASLTGDSRDARSITLYVGAEHAFSSQLNGTVRVGAEHTSYDHLSGSSWNPYVDLRGTYTYLPGSYFQLGFTQARNATDIVGDGSSTNIVKDVESSTVFASLNHRITPRVTGNVLGQYQRSTFSGGAAYDGKVDQFMLVGVNLEYSINNNWKTEIGYNFDHLSSDIPNRGFSRNRIYAGVRASF